MEKYQATKAVRSAVNLTNVLAIMFILVGALTALAGFMLESYVIWGAVITGAALVGTGLSLVILKGMLVGIESITKASEIYIEKNTETQE